MAVSRAVYGLASTSSVCHIDPSVLCATPYRRTLFCLIMLISSVQTCPGSHRVKLELKDIANETTER
jgi:hypothetical protein